MISWRERIGISTQGLSQVQRSLLCSQRERLRTTRAAHRGRWSIADQLETGEEEEEEELEEEEEEEEEEKEEEEAEETEVLLFELMKF